MTTIVRDGRTRRWLYADDHRDTGHHEGQP